MLGLPIRVASCAAMLVVSIVVPADVLAVGPIRAFSDAGSFPYRASEADQQLYLRPQHAGGLQVMVVEQVMSAELGGEQAIRIGFLSPTLPYSFDTPVNLTYDHLAAPTGILHDTCLCSPEGDALKPLLLAADAWRCLEDKQGLP